MTNVLLISSGVLHPPLLGRFHLARALAALPHVHLQHARDLAILTRPTVGAPDVVVLYFHRRRMASGALEALEAFTREGGAVLAVHSATASYKDVPRYGNLLGCEFAGHPPVGRLTIQPAPTASGPFRDLPCFNLRDEAYRHALCADIRVQCTATGVTGESMPFAWTRTYGAGRVCYIGAGHTAGAFRKPGSIALLRAGLAWLCRTGETDA